MQLAMLRAQRGGGFGTGPRPFGGASFGRRSVVGPPQFIAEAAEQLAYRVSSGPPVAVDHLARDLGIEVFSARFAAGQVGDYVGNPRPMIRVAVGDDVRSQRFTVAHALGHLLMHAVPAQVPQIMRVHPQLAAGEGTTEEEANYFATSLLVPRPMLERLLGANFPADSELLADMFQAPTLRVRQQLASLIGGPRMGW